jgi:ankyrin repeat protein
MKFSQSGSASGGGEDSQIDIDKMILHCLDCLGALQCVMGQHDPARTRVFWGAIATIADIGLDSITGHADARHPGAMTLLRAFPNDLKASDGRGWLPLHWAAVTDNVAVKDVRNIARADPLATVKGFNQPISANPGHLVAAVRHPDMQVVKCLYDFYPRMASSKDNDGDLPLHYAARYSESIDMIRFLLQANPGATKVHGEGNLVPLHCALYNESSSRMPIMKCLLEVDPHAAKLINSDGDTALHLAVDHECENAILKLIMKAYPDSAKVQNDLGLLPLHTACYLKNESHATEIVELLLKEFPGAVNVASSSGLLPAHYAAEYSSPAVLSMILQCNEAAVLNQCVEDNNSTPLIKAVTSANEDTVKFICAKYPQTVNIVSSRGQTPMHFAAESESLATLQLLWSLKPDLISTPDDEGRLPLHIFAEVHQENIAENGMDARCLRFLISKFPEASCMPCANDDSPLSICRPDNPFFRRLLLRATVAHPSRSGLSDSAVLGFSQELCRMNYDARRMAIFLAFAAINADGIPNLFCRVRASDANLLMLTLSYL